MATSASSVAARHSPAALPSLSVAQGCRATLSGDTFVPFRCPRVPRNASGELFKQFIEHRDLNMDLA
ncbi:MAG: hypothetical protein Q4A02_09905, partial [Bacteroidales bacterium]|nr:hypothetical protein [Bacteroidales bacterium]